MPLPVDDRRSVNRVSPTCDTTDLAIAELPGGTSGAGVRRPCRRRTIEQRMARSSSPSTLSLPAPRPGITMVTTMTDENRLGAMDPYGVRAMRYVRDHCPNRYRAIEDPVSFFSSLGDQLRDDV